MGNINEKQLHNLIPFIPDAEFCYMKGIECSQKQRFDLALKWMKKALEQRPDDPLIQCQIATIYTELEAYHAANELLHHVLEQTDYPDSYYLLANNYAHLGLLNEAEKYAKKYIEIEPNGDFSEDCLQLLSILTDEDESDWQQEMEDDLLLAHEFVFYEMEYMQWDEAVQALEEMLALFPDSISGRHDYAEALFYSGKQQKAIHMEEKNLEDDPNSLASFINLALFYYELKQDNYKKYICNLLHVYPVHEQQKLKLAAVFSRTGMYGEAYKRFQSLHKEKVKSHPSYYRWYARAAFHCGNKEKAQRIWKEGCSEHPRLLSEKHEWT